MAASADDPASSAERPPLDQPTLIEDRGAQPAVTQARTMSAGDPSGPQSPASTESPLTPLSRLADYEILTEVGRGGMGVVFKARHVRLGRTVALKMIIGGSLARPEDLQRFENEASAAAQLQHPGIVGVYEVGAVENQPYFSMEFISGSNLAQKVAEGPLPGRKSAAYLERVARAVHYAHGRGILHRDLKPANVLLDDNDQPKVTDFGLAKLLSTDSGQTRTGAVLGTPSYMAPEQAAGRKDLGPATDVYSCGAILYELLTGRPPFRGETALATLSLVADQEPVAPRLLNPAIDRDLETICLKCLEKDPARRYHDAEALADDLQRYLAEEPIAARRLSLVGRGIKWCRRKPTAAALIAVSVLGVLAFTYFLWRAADEERFLREQAEEAQKQAQLGQKTMGYLLYQAQVRRALQSLENADHPRAERLLNTWLPRDNAIDLRDWEWFFLNHRLHGRFSLLAHQNGWATAVAYHPQGKILASASGEPGKPSEIKLWDSATGKDFQTLLGHKGPVRALTFSKDGALLASAGYDRVVKLWDIRSGKEIAHLGGHKAHVTSVALSGDGRFLASGSGDGLVRLWDLAAVLRGEKPAPRLLEGHGKEVGAVAFAPEGTMLASAGFDGVIRIWDPESGKLRRGLTGHQGEITCLVFSPMGKILVSGGGRGGRQGELMFWEADTGTLRFTRFGLSDQVMSVAYHNGRVAAAGSDGLVRLWDSALTSEASTFRADPQIVYGLAFSPDGRHLACAGRSGRVLVANTSGGLETALFPARGAVDAIAFHPKSSRIAAAGGSVNSPGDIHVWNLEGSEKPLHFPVPTGKILALAFSPDGQRLAGAGDDKLIRIWNLDKPDQKPLVLEGHGGRIRALAFRPDGSLLASAGEDETIRLWNGQTGSFLSLLTHNHAVVCLAFSPDGKLLASGTTEKEKNLRVWNLQTNQPTLLLGHTGSVNAVAFNPSGSSLASGSSDRTIRVWDLAGQRSYVLEGSPGPVLSLAFHPRGRRLISSGQDRTIRLWDIVTRQEILELDEPTGAPRAIAISPDGRYLAAAAPDGVRLWDAGPKH